jgi:hypothetical protein
MYLLIWSLACKNPPAAPAEPVPAPVPAEPAPSPEPAPEPMPSPPPGDGSQGSPCAEGGQCAAEPAGLICVEYFGIAGPRGPKFTSCEIPCAAPATVCPSGQTCRTIADGPGAVCR